jgi:beta-glucosidase
MDIKKLINAMTLEEKVGLCSGSDFWHTKEVERLSIPKMMLSDGPHGLRKQDLESDHLGINDSIKAVCFPSGATMAASFDKELIYQVGEALGEECQAENVAVILGPAVNIKRSPLCGRNFEYLSEDPYLSSHMAASQIKGTQSKHVGTSIKHFLANNQEHRRMSSNSIIDERTLREIYLASFEIAVKEAKPWTLMCSYNRVNGVYASESYHFLTKILRDEWDFDGFVMSDWGAVNDRVHGLLSGMDLEMPSSNGVNDAKIIESVNKGQLDESIVDQSVERILTVLNRFQTNRDLAAVFDRDKHHDLARMVAGESMVLLKNEGVLPLSKDVKIAFIGEFGKKPRFQGGGSSHINCHKISNAYDAANTDFPNIALSYAAGYNNKTDSVDQSLIDEAVEVAKAADVSVVFVGLPDSYESEGYDRSHMALPKSHDLLIEAIAKVTDQVVVVLHNGSPVEMPWLDDVNGILETYLSGQAVGEATVDILFGKKNPSGKLAESFPIALEDNPSYLFYQGEKDEVEYREGIFVGYRYYDKKNMDLLFPFGHGLSYTQFEYSNMTVSKDEISEKESLEVSIRIKNIGSVYGKEVVQLYVSDRESSVIRPIKELKGFEKIALNPGEEKSVSFTLDSRSFAYYNEGLMDWHVETGEFEILIGKSSRNIQCEKIVKVISSRKLTNIYSRNSLLGDIQEDPEKAKIIEPLMKGLAAGFGGPKEGENQENKELLQEESAITNEMMEAMFRYMPLRNFVTFSGGQVSYEMIDGLIAMLNQMEEK